MDNPRVIGESSFNMTRRGGVKILSGGCGNFQTPERGTLKKVGGLQKFVYLKTNKVRGGS